MEINDKSSQSLEAIVKLETDTTQRIKYYYQIDQSFIHDYKS